MSAVRENLFSCNVGAFEQLFRHAPVNLGKAFVLVPHLDPDYKSMLAEILQRVTTMPVVEVQDQMAVEPNRVYIPPSNPGFVTHVLPPAEMRVLATQQRADDDDFRIEAMAPFDLQDGKNALPRLFPFVELAKVIVPFLPGGLYVNRRCWFAPASADFFLRRLDRR